MLTIIRVEMLKLRRSLALLLAGAAPLVVALISLFAALQINKPQSWEVMILTGSGMWAYFMLPMSVTALTVLVTQIEHGPRAWSAMLSLPVPRWRLLSAKAVIVVALVAMMHVGLLGLLFAASYVLEALKPGTFLIGAPDVMGGARLLAMMFVGSMFLIAVQLWAALRFRSFVPPLALGIGGTFLALTAAASKTGAWIPWLVAVQALRSDTSAGAATIAFGFCAGLATLAAMLIHMSRHEAK